MEKFEKIKFSDIFQMSPDGSLTPKETISVNGITFGPGISFGRDVSLGGVDFFQYQSHDIAVEKDNNILKIKGFFKKQDGGSE
ncbi:MAG: hypothetical protein GDA51_06395 [Ekhidna sp.]|nr:hypothetical protein [Ekhidna sp.]